jgi:two-component system OmpR family sensor kinase
VSLRARLLVAMLVAAFVGLAIVDVLTYALVTGAQLDQVDQELERSHPPIERAAAADPDHREQAIRSAAPGFYVEVRSPDGAGALVIPLERPGIEATVLADSELPMPDGERGDDEAVFTSLDSNADHQLRVRVSRQSDDGILVIGRSLTSIDESRERLVFALLAASAGAVVAIGLLGAWLVRVGLTPLVEVERAASEITDTDLERRVPGQGTRTEMGRLATAINRMLDRLQGAFDQREDDLAALQESEARMRQFVADASHELRTPIAATAAYAELFERGARDRPDDLARAMSGIRSETARMADLVEDLLVLAQLDEGRPLAATTVDLADLVVDAVDAANAVAPERVVHLRIEDVVIVTGDASRLRQVIDNLLANVRTHTPPGTICSVVVRATGDDGIVTVADDGQGMSPADAARAFDRFHRVDTSRTRASGGAGLGLSIVAAIVAAHHGSVTMTSAPGEGTTVTVTVPLAAGAT